MLAHHELRFAFPLMSLSYVLVYVGGVNWPALNEHAYPTRMLGIVLVMANVGLAVRSGRRLP